MIVSYLPHQLLPTAHYDSPLVRIINVLEGDILFILEQTVEFGMVSVEPQFRKQERGISLDKRSIALDSISDRSATSL
jgi:hypothetical protein